jgi:hypothetical protein
MNECPMCHFIHDARFSDWADDMDGSFELKAYSFIDLHYSYSSVLAGGINDRVCFLVEPVRRRYEYS